MIVPQFLRFYSGYTLTSMMEMYAVQFFTLINAMLRIKAQESLERIRDVSIPNADKSHAEKTIKELRKDSQGMHGIVQEVRIAKKAKERHG